MAQLFRKLPKRTAAYVVGLIALAGACSLAAASINSADASSAPSHSFTATAQAIHSQSSVTLKPHQAAAVAAAAAGQGAAATTVTPVTSGKAASPVSISSSSVNTPPAQTTAPAPGVAAPSSNGSYSGYGYQVQPTQVSATINKTSAQVCAGYLCGTDGATIKSVSGPSCGGFQFIESRDSNNIEFYIASGGLAPGNSDFSPLSINPNLPDGTYTGSIQLQLFTTPCNDTYVNGPVMGYTVTVTG